MAKIPATMKAIEISQPGGPEVLRPCQRPVPTPGEGEVLVKVAAAGVNRPDVLQRMGVYPPPPGASDLPGLEIAGEVVALGPKATGVKIGEKVCALVAGGGYAEYCTAPAAVCMPIPKGFDAVQAAATPETWMTVWSNLVDRGGLKAGTRLLVHGGASGIGTSAIQLGKVVGARVFATAGTADKCRVCEKLGAERGIDYRSEDFVQVVKAATGGEGVDLILDMVGGDYTERNLAALAPEGRLVVIAFLRGAGAKISLEAIMRKRLVVTGSTLRPRPVAFKAAIAQALVQRVWPLFEAGAIGPVIDSRFPLADAAKAHARIDAADHVGKIVLTV
jgi:putative PIG3 family NAD(P)H quinone oxidoreductase